MDHLLSKEKGLEFHDLLFPKIGNNLETNSESLWTKCPGRLEGCLSVVSSSLLPAFLRYSRKGAR